MNSKGIAFVNYEIKAEKVKATEEVAQALGIKINDDVIKTLKVTW